MNGREGGWSCGARGGGGSGCRVGGGDGLVGCAGGVTVRQAEMSWAELAGRRSSRLADLGGGGGGGGGRERKKLWGALELEGE